MTERFNNWTDVANMKEHIRILEQRVDFMREKLEAIAEAEKQAVKSELDRHADALRERYLKQEPVALIECGNCHDGLSDMDHVCSKCLGAGWIRNPDHTDTHPQPKREPLTDEQVEKIIKANMSLQMNLAGIRQDFEAAHGIKGDA